jgi:hypothetical protein
MSSRRFPTGLGRLQFSRTAVVVVPTKRRNPKERRPVFSDEIIALFEELDAVPLRKRESSAFKSDDRRLAHMLGLGAEWLCAVFSVTGRGPLRSEHSPPTRADREKVRAARLQLLEALKRRDKQNATASAASVAEPD